MLLTWGCVLVIAFEKEKVHNLCLLLYYSYGEKLEVSSSHKDCLGPEDESWTCARVSCAVQDICFNKCIIMSKLYLAMEKE